MLSVGCSVQLKHHQRFNSDLVCRQDFKILRRSGRVSLQSHCCAVCISKRACVDVCAFFAGSIVCIDPCYTLFGERVRECMRWCLGACLPYAPAHAGCSERLSGTGVFGRHAYAGVFGGGFLWRPHTHFAYASLQGVRMLIRVWPV